MKGKKTNRAYTHVSCKQFLQFCTRFFQSLFYIICTSPESPGEWKTLVHWDTARTGSEESGSALTQPAQPTLTCPLLLPPAAGRSLASRWTRGVPERGTQPSGTRALPAPFPLGLLSTTLLPKPSSKGRGWSGRKPP